MIAHLSIQRALRTKLLTLGSLPAQRAWENLNFTPTVGTSYVKEQYVPGPAFKATVGPLGEIEARPMYIVELYAAANTGMDTLSTLADAVLALFAPGTAMAVGSDTLRVAGSPAPYRGQLYRTDDGFAMVAVTIPLVFRTPNSI